MVTPANKSWAKVVLLPSLFLLLVGVPLTLFSLSAVCRGQALAVAWIEGGHVGRCPHDPTVDAIGSWIDPYLLVFGGVLLTLVGIVGCSGFVLGIIISFFRNRNSN